MVQFTKILLKKLRIKTRNYMRAGFRDSLAIYVQGGNGGNGLPKFGGCGGKGGDVIAVAKENISLEEVFKSNKKKQYIAMNGKHSTHNFILGPPGEDIKIEVPIGVKLKTAELGKELGELNEEGQELLLARGGPGGHSKNGFLGVRGQGYPVLLDLKLIADIGLVGFPNAGKSTLLKAISDAKPKIASYPFTTIRPNLGIIQFKDFRRISMADLPGLIEGAYANRGMGHNFLKHVERTKLILLVVDVNGFQLGPQYPHRNCMENILLLNKELELYNQNLINTPSIILINKMDTDGAKEKYEEVKHQLDNLKSELNNYDEKFRPNNLLKICDIVPISAKDSPDDINQVKTKLRVLLDVMADLETKKSEEENTSLFHNIKESQREKGPSLV